MPDAPREIGYYVSETRQGAGRIVGVSVKIEIVVTHDLTPDEQAHPAMAKRLEAIARKIERAAQAERPRLAALAQHYADYGWHDAD